MALLKGPREQALFLQPPLDLAAQAIACNCASSLFNSINPKALQRVVWGQR